MNRGWINERDRISEYAEGSDPARSKALLLAEIADADFIETIIQIKSALDAFGGKVLLGAKRIKFTTEYDDRVHSVEQAIQNFRVDEDQVGVHRTVAYIAQYDAAPVRGEPEEPPTTFADAEAAFERKRRLQVKESAPETEQEPVPA